MVVGGGGGGGGGCFVCEWGANLAFLLLLHNHSAPSPAE